MKVQKQDLPGKYQSTKVQIEESEMMKDKEEERVGGSKENAPP